VRIGEPPRRTVIQCINRSTVTQQKAEADMAAAVAAPTGAPGAFRFVARGAISAARRDAIDAAARRIGISYVTIWSDCVDLRRHRPFELT
jgi:hypothetical protein